ncbi:MAG: ATP-binding protein [Bacteroidota bacterium]
MRLTIVTSQQSVSTWHEVINEKTIADAVLDRLVHSSHGIDLRGESMRKKRKNIKRERINFINLMVIDYALCNFFCN